MSNQRKKTQLRAKREQRSARDEQRRLAKLAEEGRLVHGVEIPKDAVPADHSQQVPNDSYSGQPAYYTDTDFTCVDCGREEVWTGEQQKWYYEVAKASLYAAAIRCRECRRKRKEQHDGRGDPNPIKHTGSLMKRVRESLETPLAEAGFEFTARNNSSESRSAWMQYSRPGLTLFCSYDFRHTSLVAETMDEQAECRIVADVSLRTSGWSQGFPVERIDEFSALVREFLQGLAGAGADVDTE